MIQKILQNHQTYQKILKNIKTYVKINKKTISPVPIDSKFYGQKESDNQIIDLYSKIMIFD